MSSFDDFWEDSSPRDRRILHLRFAASAVALLLAACSGSSGSAHGPLDGGLPNSIDFPVPREFAVAAVGNVILQNGRPGSVIVIENVELQGVNDVELVDVAQHELAPGGSDTLLGGYGFPPVGFAFALAELGQPFTGDVQLLLAISFDELGGYEGVRLTYTADGERFELRVPAAARLCRDLDGGCRQVDDP